MKIAIAVRRVAAAKEQWVSATELSFADVLRTLAVLVPKHRIRFQVVEE